MSAAVLLNEHTGERPISLGGIRLTDVITGDAVDLGLEPPRALLTVIRHRY